MCGIALWISKSGQVDPDRLFAATHSMLHRGPDRQLSLFYNQQGFHRSPFGLSSPAEFKVGLGHSRLSIIDLDVRSDQPMLSADGRYAIIFNGEIYNYKELRLELEERGHCFRTSGDTEVALYALIEWGYRASERFNGMWAYALLDTQHQRVILSRDRYGKKPLYYWFTGKDFFAASEPKALFAMIGEEKREFNRAFLEAYVAVNRWQVLSDQDTPFSNLRFFPAGNSAEFDLQQHSISFFPHNTIEHWIPHEAPSPEMIAEDFRSSIALRLRSDVPVAILLSGGIDSTAVAAHAAALPGGDKIKWYTGNTGYGQDPHFSYETARALGVQVTEVNVQNQGIDTLDIVAQMTEKYELPVWLLGNSIAMFQMYKAMAKDGIRVVLDGTGGDEIFGGYYNFFAYNVISELVQQKSYLEAGRFIVDCARYKHSKAKDLRAHALRIKSGTQDLSKERDLSLKAAQKRFITHGHLPHWLLMNDMNSMSHSIEARSPFLDYRLVKYVQMPVQMKFRKGFNKFALRCSLPSSVPDSVRWRRDKQGFRWKVEDLFTQCRDRIYDTIKSSSLLETHFAEEKRAFERNTPETNTSLYTIAELERVSKERYSGSRANTKIIQSTPGTVSSIS